MHLVEVDLFYSEPNAMIRRSRADRIGPAPTRLGAVAAGVSKIWPHFVKTGAGQLLGSRPALGLPPLRKAPASVDRSGVDPIHTRKLTARRSAATIAWSSSARLEGSRPAPPACHAPNPTRSRRMPVRPNSRSSRANSGSLFRSRNHDGSEADFRRERPASIRRARNAGRWPDRYLSRPSPHRRRSPPSAEGSISVGRTPAGGFPIATPMASIG